MESLAMDMAETMQLTPDNILRVLIIPDDERYMLSITPITKSIMKYIRIYVKEVYFNTFQSGEQSIIQSHIISDNVKHKLSDDKPMKPCKFIMSGRYYLLNKKTDRINFSLEIIKNKRKTVFQSIEYSISSTDCPKALKRKIFTKIQDKQEYANIEYRGRVIDQLNIIFNTIDNNFLAAPAIYKFELKHPYALQWQIDELKNILAAKYLISFNQKSSNYIRIDQTGSFLIKRNNLENSISKLVDGEPLLPDKYLHAFDSLLYLHAQFNNATTIAPVEKKRFSTKKELTVKNMIREIFSDYYPKLFNPFNYEVLNSLFISKDRPSILVGFKKSSNPVTGKEVVRYRWHSKQSWLTALLKSYHQKEHFFEVQTEVMGIFEDNCDNNRYWAIVLQIWKTKDRSGHIVYEDKGFLIVNLDFKSDLTINNFKIHYRLWFYEYQFDEVELGLSRYQKLTNDLDNYFVNGITGIDENLKNSMRSFIIKKISTNKFVY